MTARKRKASAPRAKGSWLTRCGRTSAAAAPAQRANAHSAAASPYVALQPEYRPVLALWEKRLSRESAPLLPELPKNPFDAAVFTAASQAR